MSRASRRDRDSTTPVRTLFLPRGSASAVHCHDEPAAWLHVVAGTVVEERWTPDAEGGFVREQRRLRPGQSMAAPADVLHRITAVDDAAIVSTCLCDCASAPPTPAPDLDAVARLCRSAADRAWAATTAPGTAAP